MGVTLRVGFLGKIERCIVCILVKKRLSEDNNSFVSLGYKRTLLPSPIFSKEEKGPNFNRRMYYPS